MTFNMARAKVRYSPKCPKVKDLESGKEEKYHQQNVSYETIIAIRDNIKRIEVSKSPS